MFDNVSLFFGGNCMLITSRVMEKLSLVMERSFDRRRIPYIPWYAFAESFRCLTSGASERTGGN